MQVLSSCSGWWCSILAGGRFCSDGDGEGEAALLASLHGDRGDNVGGDEFSLLVEGEEGREVMKVVVMRAPLEVESMIVNYGVEGPCLAY